MSPQTKPFEGWAAEIRTLGALAAPVVLGQLGMFAMGLVDVLMVAPLGAVPLAGVSLGHTWSFGCLVLLLGVSVGFDPLFSQAFGADRPGIAWRRLMAGTRLLCLLCLPIACLHWIGPQVLAWMNQDPAASDIGGMYTQITVLGIVPFAAFGVLRQFLQGSGLMMPATWAIIVGNVCNFFLNLAFVYGYFGVPEWGAIGTAWATVICRWLMLIVLVMVSSRALMQARHAATAVPAVLMMRLVPVSAPVGLQISAEFWGFSLSTFFVGWFGATAVAGHMLALNLASAAFMIPLGISTAAATRVGNLLGAKFAWQRSAWVAVGLGVSMMACTGGLFWFIPSWLLWPYQAEHSVEMVALTLLPVAAVFAIFDGAQVVLFGVLRGAGDTFWPAVANLIGYYLLGVPLGLYLAFGWEWGPMGIWCGLAIALAIVAHLLVLRLAVTAHKGGTVLG